MLYVGAPKETLCDTIANRELRVWTEPATKRKPAKHQSANNHNNHNEHEWRAYLAVGRQTSRIIFRVGVACVQPVCIGAANRGVQAFNSEQGTVRTHEMRKGGVVKNAAQAVGLPRQLRDYCAECVRVGGGQRRTRASTLLWR